jgi:hypothetical protein
MKECQILHNKDFDRENHCEISCEESSDCESTDDENISIGNSATEFPIKKMPVKTNYFLNIGNCFNIGIEENVDMLIINKNEDKNYTEKDLENEYVKNTINDIGQFYITKIPTLLKYKNKGQRKFRYVIGVEYNNAKLLFVPIFVKNDVITSFACVSVEKYEMLHDQRFSPNPGGYPSVNTINLHEKVHGKKAEKGGWYKLEKNAEDGNLKAIWITMISGRSLNQYDPNQDSRDFYYYHNSENGFNIKAPAPKNFIEGFYDVPKITEGNPGDFYKDKNGDIYMKVDVHNIDHIDGEPFDVRTHKLREITLSANQANRRKVGDRYSGVVKTPAGRYQGVFLCRGKRLNKNFQTEIEAARFYDYYSLAIHGVRTMINNVLPTEVENDLLLYGIEKIPLEYRIKEKKTLPKGINLLPSGKYWVIKSYLTLKFDKICESYEEAFEALQEAEKEIDTLKEKEKEDTLELNKANYNDTYGYIVIEKDGKEYKIKLNIIAYKEFVHYTWYMRNGRPNGSYKGKRADLHIHVIGFYIPHYNRREMGTVDHRDQDPLDCTIESLNPESASLQAQNAKSKNIWGFKGVILTFDNFSTNYKGKMTGGFDCLEDAAREHNNQVEKDLGRDENGRVRGYINIIPEGKRTTLRDLFSMDQLTSEMVQEANIGEIKAIIIVNPEFKKFMPSECREIRKINKDNYEIIRDKIITELLKLE